MSKDYVKWYGKCVDSLFFKSKDSWVCRKVVELSAGIEKGLKEEIIMDTKFRFRALLDYTIGEIEHLDYEAVKNTLERIRSSNKRYYLAYNHAIEKG